MTTSEHKYLSDFARKYSPEARARIDSCSDVALLDRWIARAATAVTSDEIVSERST